MAARFTFEIVTPQGVAFTDEAWEIILPTTNGAIGVLPGHITALVALVPGVVTVYQSADRSIPAEHLAIFGGFVEVTKNRVRLFADSAEHADDIDELTIQQALAEARRLKKEAKDSVSLAEVTSLIEQHALRLKVAELKRHHVRRTPKPHADRTA